MRNTIQTVTPAAPWSSAIAALPALAGLLALASCSVVPERVEPPHHDFEVVADYDFAGGAPVPVEVPASNEVLTVLTLQAEPSDVRETFEAGRRLLTAPDGTLHLRVRCRYRVYGSTIAPNMQDPNAPARLFPSADRLRLDPAPSAGPELDLDPDLQSP